MIFTGTTNWTRTLNRPKVFRDSVLKRFSATLMGVNSRHEDDHDAGTDVA